MKKAIKIILGIIILLAVNLAYYVFIGQNRSMEKLTQNKELNLYEKVSVYQMHCSVWMLGWPISPEAANECFKLHFPQKDTVLIHRNLDSPRIRKAIESLKYPGQSVQISWNGNEAYDINNPEHRAAIAVNPCKIKRTSNFVQDGSFYGVEITSSMQYPKQSNTKFELGFTTIRIQEGLFRYLQDKHWLSTYTALYYSSSTWPI